MEVLLWSKEFVVGNQNIDTHHKKLFNYLFVLVEAQNNNDDRKPIVEKTLEDLLQALIVLIPDWLSTH